MFEPKPLITRRPNGEYSTVTLSDGTVETCWFPDSENGRSVVVGRTERDRASIARAHINAWEGRS